MSIPATPKPLVTQLNGEQINRYKRHLILPEVGVEGQKKLLNAKVLCIGAGGLGSPISLYLAAAGVGTIGMADVDVSHPPISSGRCSSASPRWVRIKSRRRPSV